jgi:tetratricopeptide (TPR) repeat protein
MKKRMVKKRDIDSILVFYYSKKLERKPDSFMFMPLAGLYRKKGMPELAIQTCLKGLKFHPHYTGARALLGFSYYDCEKFDDAERELRKAVDSAADNILARRVLSDIYRKKGRIDDALKEMEALAFLAPGNKDFNALKENLQKLNKQQQKTSEEAESVFGVRDPAFKIQDTELQAPGPESRVPNSELEKLLDDSAAFEEIAGLFPIKTNEYSQAIKSDGNGMKTDSVEILENWLKNIEREYNEDTNNKRA